MAPLLLLLLTAQTPDIAKEDLRKKVEAKKDDEKKKEEGWAVKAKIGGSGSLLHNHNVVGAEAGTTAQVGLVLGASGIYEEGPHTWENVLSSQFGTTRVPSLGRFVKSADQLVFESTYLYRLSSPDWLGGFVKVRFDSPMVITRAYRTDDYVGERRLRDGTVQAGVMFPAKQRIPLTGSFEPVLLRESLGIFARPWAEKIFTLKAKLGGAVQHVIARDGFVVVEEDADANTIILKQLESTNDFGAELGIDLSGFFVEDIVTWSLAANLFQPFVSTTDQDLSLGDLLNAQIVASLSVKLVKWLSLDYVLTIKRIPIILDEWQVQNQVILTAGFDLL